MSPEQVFQLKLASTDLAVRAGATNADVVTQATAIYEFIASEAIAKQEPAKQAAVLSLTKPTITEIGVALNRE